jgi:hypothetical protein
LPERHVIPRLVVRIAPAHTARLVDLADEVVRLAEEVILDAGNLPDDCLERVAAFVEAVSTQSTVKVCGLRGSQMRELVKLGTPPRSILIGRPRRPD